MHPLLSPQPLSWQSPMLLQHCHELAQQCLQVSVKYKNLKQYRWHNGRGFQMLNKNFIVGNKTKERIPKRR